MTTPAHPLPGSGGSYIWTPEDGLRPVGDASPAPEAEPPPPGPPASTPKKPAKKEA